MSCTYRDPVTQLPILPLEAMDGKARNAFHRLLQPQRSPPAADGVIPVILFYAPIVRCTRRGRCVSRYLLLSRNHWYVCKPTGEVSRCCCVYRIVKVILCSDNYVVWKVSHGRDVVMRFGDAHTVGSATNVLHVLNSFAAGRPLPVVEKRGVRHTELRGSERPQLEGAGGDVDECPLPLVSVNEAQRQHTPSVSLASATPVTVDDDQNTDVSHHAGHAAAVAPRDEKVSCATPAAVSTIHRIWPVGRDVKSVAKETELLALNANVAPVQTAAVCRPPPPPPLLRPAHFGGSLHLESGGTLRERSALWEPREVMGRSLFLECRDKSPGQSCVQGGTDSRFMHDTSYEKNGILGTPRSLPAAPCVRREPLPHTLPLYAAAGPNAADFEQDIAANTPEERVVLRDCEIDSKLWLVSLYINKGDAQQLVRVNRLQEDLLLLLQAQRADEELLETQRKELAVTHTLTSAEEGSYSDTLEEEEEEEETFGRLQDSDLWVSTDAGKQWYNDNFGEHLSACKMMMVQKSFERSATLL